MSTLDKLIRALKSEDPRLRKAAAEHLGEHYGGESVVNALIELLKDPDWFVRLEAVRALGRIKDEAAIPALKDLYFEALRRNLDMSIPVGFHEFVRHALSDLGWELGFGGFEKTK